MSLPRAEFREPQTNCHSVARRPMSQMAVVEVARHFVQPRQPQARTRGSSWTDTSVVRSSVIVAQSLN